MANPNIVNVTDIRGENIFVNLTTANATQIVSNAASSNKIYKINSLVISNKNTSITYNVTVRTYSAASLGGTAFSFITALNIPPKTSVIVIDKSNSIYLKENQSLGVQASHANQFEVTCSWEEIS